MLKRAKGKFGLHQSDRRTFIGAAVTASSTAIIEPFPLQATTGVTLPQPVIPRWRGFNVIELSGTGINSTIKRQISN